MPVLIEKGLREIEWVEFNMKSSASLVASGKMRLASCRAPGPMQLGAYNRTARRILFKTRL